MSHRTNAFRVFAISVTASLALAATAQLYLFEASEDAVSRSMRYDVAWTGTNGRIEAVYFEKHLARYAALRTEQDADIVRVFYEILLSRLETWNSGGFKHLIQASPERKAAFETISAKILGLKPYIERLEQPDALRHALDTMNEVATIIDKIGAEAHTISVRESSEIRAVLRYQHLLQRWLVIILLASGAGALVFTARQNHSLRLANSAAAKNAERLSFLALHDPLTNLPNRSSFETSFRSALQSKSESEWISIAAIDLDGFKSVNDLLGHAAGDAVLNAVSEILVTEAQRDDPRNVVCRIGGDEFLALLWTPNDPSWAMGYADRILAAFEHPLETEYGEIMIGASVGIAHSEIEPHDDVIVNADLALTKAKVMGKGIALLFTPEMQSELTRRLRLEADLSVAIAGGDIVPFYQPKVDLASCRLVGFEALARWLHPELGWVPPGEFIPIAESSGAIVKIGRKMLEAACRDAKTLPGDIGVAVNLSVLQILKDDIVSVVRTVLRDTGLPPQSLTLEITESVMIMDPDKVLEVLTQLKGLGVRISLDDFGTGYSALSYLTKFNWDELKIDQGFIRDALFDPMNLMIIKTVRMLAREMNAKLTIEGVETPEQCTLLCEIGCDTAQGYLFSPPMPFQDLQPFLLRDLARAMYECDREDTNAERRQSYVTSVD